MRLKLDILSPAALLALSFQTHAAASTEPHDDAQSAADIHAHMPLGGDGKSYLQPVPLLAYRAADQGALLLKDAQGKDEPLKFGEDYLVHGSPLGAALKISAPLVFAAFGVVAPEHGRDDYAGLDVRGKIVLLLDGAPKNYQSEERAYYGNGRTKAALALAHGASGVLSLDTLTDEKLYPFPNATLDSELKEVQSENVVGLLEGSDPNAAGVATTLEVAKLFRSHGRAPKRSLLFLIDTAEEKGLVGAEYFAHNPTVPAKSIVANVDLDMPILTYEFTDVVAFGAERSGIGPSVKKAAERMNVKLSPDPMPDEGIFTRSDHYRFVEQGVPAVYLITGFANGGEAAFTDFMAHHYHKPSDDMNLPLRFDVGAKFARLNYEITRELAESPIKPAWNKGDFFGGKFGKQ